MPKLRFKGFVGEWEEDFLGNNVEFFSGLTYSPLDVVKEIGTLVLRSSNVQNGEIVDADNVYVNSDVVNCKNVEVGDIAVVVRNGSRNLIGKHALVKNEMKNTVIGAFMTGISSETPSFTNALLSTKQFTAEVNKNLGATINQITTGSFRNMKFHFTNRNEAMQIGAFFEGLDTNLTQHQTQLEKLKNLKQAMLYKMFPQNGATEPEIRFKGFSESWKKAFLNDAAIIAKGQALSSRNLADGIYPVIAGGKTSPYSHNQYTHEQVITVSASGAYAGYVAYHPNKIWASDCSTLQPKNNNNLLYLFYVLIGLQPLIYSLQTGGAQPHVYPTDLAGLRIFLPTDKKEQQKIGNYFHKLDQLITLQTTQLKKLQQIKQACLTGMFA